MVKNIQLTVSEKNVTSEDCPLRWSSNTVDYITATFALDDEWKSCDLVRAVWVAPQAQIVTVLDANGTCVVPHEVLSKIGKVYVNLYGIVYEEGDEFTRITTYPFNAIRIDGDAKIEGSETAPITPSQFEQFVETVLSETQKVTGMTATAETLPSGSEATASYSDGVLSLGIPRGIQGEKGDTGERGLQGIQGERGERGEQGLQGIQGERGERGETGATGAKGDTGNGISSITKTGSSGLVDTYTITFTDGTSTTFNVTNGKDGSGADIDVDSALSTTSTNPVQNKVITNALNSKANTSSLASVATSGNYNDLSNKPTIPTVPTNVSAFTNDAGYITSVPSEYVTETELNTAIAGKANTADLATVATSGSYEDLTNKPTIPTVPTNVSAFTNDAHYITSAGAPVQSVNGQTGNALLDAMDIETLDDVAVNVASGNPVTISNAENENAVKVTATLEPIQDLHGYDHPWAGGAGKNLLPSASSPDTINTLKGVTATISDDGAITLNGTATAVGYIQVPFSKPLEIKKYTATLFNPVAVTNGGLQFSVRKQNVNYSAGGWFVPNTVNRAYTFTTGAEAYWWQLQIDNKTVFSDYKVFPMLVEGETAPTAYEPYSNICPISGRTAVDVTRTGKNKFNGASVTTTHSSNWGIDWNESTNALTITHKASYTTGVPSLTLDLAVGTYVASFASQTKAESISIYTNGAYTKILRNGTSFSVESGNSYEVRFNADEGTPNVIKNFQIESGSTATAYEPYTGQSVTVNLGQTVYGGSLNVTAGELTVDKGYVDLGTLNWSVSASDSNKQDFSSTGLASVIKRVNEYTLPNAICSIFVEQTRNAQYLNPTSNYNTIGVTTSGFLRVLTAPNTYADATAFKTAMSGVQLVYELATPQTYQLTPAQINLLTGTNIITTNADELSVRYYASGKGNVEGSLTLLAEELTDLQTALNTKASAWTVQTMTASDTAVTLNPNVFYVFPEMATLAVTVTAVGMYAFRFTSGTAATTLTVTGATMPDSFEVESGKVYEVNVYQGYGVVSEWTA